jgi:hypothetical protein
MNIHCSIALSIAVFSFLVTPSMAQTAGSCVGVLTQGNDGNLSLEYQQDGTKMYCEGMESDVKEAILKNCAVGKRCEVLGMLEEIGDNGTDLWIRVVFKVRQME